MSKNTQAEKEIQARLDELEGVEKLRQDNWKRHQAYPNWPDYYASRKAFLESKLAELKPPKNKDKP